MKSIHWLAVILALGGSACAHDPAPYQFSIGQTKNPIDVMVRTLAANGLKAEVVDRAGGDIVTRWFDTGYRFREIDDFRPETYYTDIFLRYHVHLATVNGQQQVTLSADVQRCAPTDSIITSRGVEGSCQALSKIFPTQQKQEDELGAKLKLALADGHA
jgi:hypothetical protein